MRIALDGLGGDLAPKVTVQGALLALRDAPEKGLDDLSVVLVGDQTRLLPFLPDPLPAKLYLVDADPPDENSVTSAAAIGEQAQSAIRIALRLHREGDVQGVVSAGSTAAQVVASLIELEKCYGITRPAIGSFLPTLRGASLLIDIGASLVATPHHLVQFAAMGHVYVREMLGIAEPRIGLINVGSEAFVGDRNVIEAHKLLDDSGFNFVGFIEGRDIAAGKADVLVTNGFVGNVILKFAEGIPTLLNAMVANLGDQATESVAKNFDYNAHGGEPLLGVKGVSIICHGASSERAVAQGIYQAAKISKLRLPDKLEDFLADKFATYFSQVKYLRSFRRSLRSAERLKGD